MNNTLRKSFQPPKGTLQKNPFQKFRDRQHDLHSWPYEKPFLSGLKPGPVKSFRQKTAIGKPLAGHDVEGPKLARPELDHGLKQSTVCFQDYEWPLASSWMRETREAGKSRLRPSRSKSLGDDFRGSSVAQNLSNLPANDLPLNRLSPLRVEQSLPSKGEPPRSLWSGSKPDLSILDKRGLNSDKLDVVVRKCACKSPDCPDCGPMKNGSWIAKRMESMDWKATRQFMVTINPKLFKDGEQAYLEVMKKRRISRLIRELKRTHGVRVRSWFYIREWHANGFPHWHVFVDVGVRGRAGMVGGDLLRKYWPLGAVRESYFKDHAHWDHVKGYAAKHGYFEKNKKHQIILPDWAKNYPSGKLRKKDGSRKIIKKTAGPREKSDIEKIPQHVLEACTDEVLKSARLYEYFIEMMIELEEEGKEKKSRKRRTYAAVLAMCGATSRVIVDRGQIDEQMLHDLYMAQGARPLDIGIEFKLNLPYKFVKDFGDKGEYKEGLGIVKRITKKELIYLLAANRQAIINECRKGFEIKKRPKWSDQSVNALTGG